MLCRTANELYWMGRHIERAENTARLLDVTYRMALLPYETIEPGLAWAEPWAVPLITSGLATDFYESYQQLSAENVLRFMILDSANTSSIYCCLRAARESARAVRGAITSEMYEDLNSAWLEMRVYDYNRIQSSGVSEFLDWVKMRSHLFRGVTFGTMLRDEAYHFIRLGTHIERADNTARILDVKYHTCRGRRRRGRLLSVERAVALGVWLRVVSQDLQRRDHTATGSRAADPARGHAAITAFVHELHSRNAAGAVRRQLAGDRTRRRRVARQASLRPD